MTKDQVIERFCALASMVGEVKFSHTEAYDCFCGQTGEDVFGFQFSHKVLKFIEDAVEKELLK